MWVKGRTAALSITSNPSSTVVMMTFFFVFLLCRRRIDGIDMKTGVYTCVCECVGGVGGSDGIVGSLVWKGCRGLGGLGFGTAWTPSCAYVAGRRVRGGCGRESVCACVRVREREGGRDLRDE
jgi:hypothetical protein